MWRWGYVEFGLVLWLLCDYNKVTSCIWFGRYLSSCDRAAESKSPAAMCISEL